MKPWKQALLIGALGLTGAVAGLGVAMLAFGPASMLGLPGGEWVVRTLFDPGTLLPDGRSVITPGKAVPALPLHDRDGQPYTLEPGGRPILINYWASWCPPCIKEMPLLDAFAAQQGPDGVRVVGIALDDAAPVEEFLTRHPVAFEIYLEPSGPNDSSALLGNVRGVLPYSVLIGADGRLVKTRMGAFHAGDLERWHAD